jgi:hypothetical protein
LGVLELGVRIARGKLFDTTLLSAEYQSVSKEREQPRAQYDPVLGWVPNLGRRETQGATYTIIDGNIRSNGDRKPGKDDKVILVGGDSFSFGEEVSDHETWPAQLEQLSSKRVINGAVFNYGVDQVVLRTERLVERYEPAVLIIGFIPDDIFRCAQSVRMQPKPYFRLLNGELTLYNVPVPLLETDAQHKEMDLFRRYLGYSHLADFFMRRIDPLYWLNQRIVLVADGGFRDIAGAARSTSRAR